MKKGIFLLIAFALVLGLQSPLLAAKPAPSPIDGQWLLDISGTEQGGSVLTFVTDLVDTDADPNTETGIFTGYAYTREGGPYNLTDGEYTVDIEKGTITGSYLDPEAVLKTFTAKADKKRTKISFKFANGLNAKAIRLPNGPNNIPEFWDVTGKDQNGDIVTFVVEIAGKPDEANPPNALPRVYTVTGAGSAATDPPVDLFMQGEFILTSKSVAYGIYELYDGNLPPAVDQVPLLTGVFTGKLNLSSKKFVFKTDSGGVTGILKGEAQR